MMEGAKALPDCEHYMGWRSYGNGTWAHVCIYQHCDFVDVKGTIKGLELAGITKAKNRPYRPQGVSMKLAEAKIKRYAPSGGYKWCWTIYNVPVGLNDFDRGFTYTKLGAKLAVRKALKFWRSYE